MKYSNLNVSAFQYAIKTIAMFPKSEDFSPEEFKYVDDVSTYRMGFSPSFILFSLCFITKIFRFSRRQI